MGTEVVTLVREVLNKDEWEAWEQAADPFLDPESYSVSCKQWARIVATAKDRIRALLLPNGEV